jgi:hypothetical protein
MENIKTCPSDGYANETCDFCGVEFSEGHDKAQDGYVCSKCEYGVSLEKDLEKIFGQHIAIVRVMDEDCQFAGFFPNGLVARFSDTDVVMNPTADLLLWNWQPATVENILKAATGCWDV